MYKNQFLLLTKAKFLPLFLTQFFGAFNDNILKNALVVLITYDLAVKYNYNGQILVVLCAGIFILPMVLFSATAGQIADKYEKSRLIKIIKFIEIFLILISCIGFYLENIFILITALCLMGVQSTFFGPLKYSILPEHLSKDQLIGGNALISAATFLAILLGTLAGTLIILQKQGVFIIVILMLLVSIFGWACSLAIPCADLKAADIKKNIKIDWLLPRITWQLFRYTAKNRHLLLPILGISWFWLIGAAYLAQFPTYSKDIIHGDEKISALFLLIFSVGVGLGALTCNKLLKGRIQATFVPIGALGMAAFGVDLYFSSINVSFSLGFNGNIIRLLIDLFGISFSGGIYVVPLYAMLQHYSTGTHRARVIAANNIMNALFMVIVAVAIMAMLAYNFSIPEVFLTISILTLIVAILVCCLLPLTLIRSIAKILLNILYKVDLEGIEHYHQAGQRVLIIANHTSFLDVILLVTYISDQLIFAINSGMANKTWMKLLLNLVEAHPVDPTNPMAAKTLIDVLKNNKKCVIFPEGRITVTGALMKIYEGPCMIADKSDAVLLPIRIDGAQYTMFSYLRNKVRIRLFPRIKIKIFQPQRIKIDKKITGRNRRKAMGLKLYDLMVDMTFASSNYKSTLFSALLEARSRHDRKEAIIEDMTGNNFNYNKLIKTSLILGWGIKKYTEKQQICGIMLPNSVLYSALFFALQSIGRIAAPLDFTRGKEYIIAACKMANIKIVFTTKNFMAANNMDILLEIFSKININIVLLESLSKPKIFNLFIYRQENIVADDPAALMFTPGETGPQKGVLLSHKNLLASVFQLASKIDFNSQDVVLNALPIYNVFGLISGILSPILCGFKTFLYPSTQHYKIIPEIAYDLNATILFAEHNCLCGYANAAHAYDFYSMRYVFAIGKNLSSDLKKIWIEKFGIRIFAIYGLVESSSMLAINTPMHYKSGTVGRFLPGVKYKLENGKLLIKGPNIMLAYFSVDFPGEPKKILDNSWFEIHDMVNIDLEGYLKIS